MHPASAISFQLLRIFSNCCESAISARSHISAIPNWFDVKRFESSLFDDMVRDC
jgi:hypothetical protein